MNAYAIAWLIIVLCLLGGAGMLFYLMKSVQRPLLRVLAISITVTFFLIPAPVPGHTEQLAPAFVVSIFETFFQIDGEPQVSLRILLLAIGVVGFLTWLVSMLMSKHSSNLSRKEGSNG